MRIIALFALLLVAASATSMYDKYPINFTQKRSIMTLLTQVESQLKSGGPLDAITKMLAEFKTTILEEQIQHDNLWAQQQNECASEFAFREEEVSSAVAALKEASETLDGCTSQNVRAEGDLQVTKQQLGEARALLAVAVDTRRREAYAFETASNTFTQTSASVDEALVILEELWNGEASFAQLSSHVNGILRNSVKVRKAHLLGGVMAALAQMGSKDLQADEGMLNRVRTLLTNFREKLEAEFNFAAAAEQAAIEAYNQEKSRLDTMIEQLEAQRQGLLAEIDALNKCIVVQSGIVSSATTKRDRNQRIWDDAKALCSAVEEEYHTSTEARREELQLLAAITQRVEARFAELSAGVVQRGETDAEDFEYTNATAIDGAKFVSSTGRSA